MVNRSVTAERLQATTLRASSLDAPSRAFTSDEPLPRALGRYVLVDQIGAGPTARIFRGVNVSTEGFRRVVAVKRLRPTLAASPEAARTFTEAARAGALLNHPYVAQLYELGEDDGGERFMVLEHVDGIDLGRALRLLADRGRAVLAPVAALICQQAAEALHHAHIARGRDGRPLAIVHGNLTPSNMMLARNGVVKLLGFGGAARDALSPEQALAQAPEARSDLFALGAVLWELLAGRQPFGADRDVAGDSGPALVRRALQGPVPRPSFYNASVPPALEQIAMRALDRDAGCRYQTAQAMADDLARFVHDQPFERRPIAALLDEIERPSVALRPALYASPSLLAPRPQPARRASAFRRRRRGVRAMLMSVGACLLLAAAAVVAAAVGRLAPASARPVPLASARDFTAEVEIDISSEPPGVLVQGSQGPLGQTPLRIRLPIAQDVERLLFDREGYQPLTYDVHPRSAGAVFVELQPLKGAPR